MSSHVPSVWKRISGDIKISITLHHVLVRTWISIPTMACGIHRYNYLGILPILMLTLSITMLVSAYIVAVSRGDVAFLFPYIRSVCLFVSSQFCLCAWLYMFVCSFVVCLFVCCLFCFIFVYFEGFSSVHYHASIGVHCRRDSWGCRLSLSVVCLFVCLFVFVGFLCVVVYLFVCLSIAVFHVLPEHRIRFGQFLSLFVCLFYFVGGGGWF